MISERLMGATEYLPPLERLGLVFVEVIQFGDIPHTVMRTPSGKRFIYPGVQSRPDEVPMIPARKMNDLLSKAANALDDHIEDRRG